MKRRGFTLIELLVVVAIIAILIAILIPTLGKAREQSMRAICAGNLSGHGKAMAIYSGQFNDTMPVVANPMATNLNDETITTAGGLGWADLLIAQPSATGSVIAKWFFCPANNAAANNTGTALGYAYMNVRAPENDLTIGGASLPNITNATAGLRASPPFTYHSKFLNNLFAAASELGLDNIVNSGLTTDFSAPVLGGTNHMASDTFPSGANVLYFDGHVKYQKFLGPTLPKIGSVDPLNQQVLKTSGAYFYFPAP